jgi:hypothetical protein
MRAPQKEIPGIDVGQPHRSPAVRLAEHPWPNYRDRRAIIELRRIDELVCIAGV